MQNIEDGEINVMNAVGKRLLILGAGRGQVGLYEAARQMGIITIAGTMPDNNPPCLKLADEICYMDIANPNDVVDKSKKLNIDGIATCCLDTGLSSLGKACDEFGLVGLTSNAAMICNDKSKMKKAFIQGDVNTAKYFEIHNEIELEDALKKIQFPVIIKATDLQGSNGIYISKNKEEAFNGFREAMKKTKHSYCIIEEYIEGWEFGAQAFVYQGDILFVMPHGDETFMAHTAVPIGHYIPLECDEDILIQTEDIVKKAIKVIGLNNCAVNVDLIAKDGKVYMIEITGRVGANCLPELVEIYFGIEYYKMIAAIAVGCNPLEYWKTRNAVRTAGLTKMIFSTEKKGILERIEYTGEITEDILEITFFKHQGDEIRIFENSNDCVGQIIVKGNIIYDCKKLMQGVLDQIDMKLK